MAQYIDTEGMLRAACIMRDAAEKNARAADRIEDSVRQLHTMLDDGYGNNACRLIELLSKADAKGETV